MPWSAVAPFVMQGIQTGGNLLGQKLNYRNSKRLAKYQYKQDMKMMEYQNFYNSPANQRSLLEAGGYNPNLALQTAQQGSMSSAPKYPDVQGPDYTQVFGDLATQHQQLKLMQSQTSLLNAKTGESTVKADLNRAQTDLVKANPYLNKSYVSAMILQLESAANLKASEYNLNNKVMIDRGDGQYSTAAMAKVENSVRLLDQRFNLNSADQKIKGEILQSKQFQNALQELQVQWMRDGDITPQHIYQGIMLLLAKFMR